MTTPPKVARPPRGDETLAGTFPEPDSFGKEPIVGIRDMWRTATRSIAGRNSGSFGEPLGADIGPEEYDKWISRHASTEVDLLCDCVTFLIWATLARFCQGTQRSTGRHEYNDRFLSVTDFREYLLNRIPVYTRNDVDEFIESLFRQRLLSPHPTRRPAGKFLAGDLRVWLQQARYKTEEIDIKLRELEAEPFLAPPAGLKRIRDDEQRARSLDQWTKQTQRRLLEQLDRGVPRLVTAWAWIITLELVTGTCNCPASFTGGPNEMGHARSRCHETHFLSEVNLARAFKGGSQRWKHGISDELDFVERAVVFGLQRVYRRREKGRLKYDLKALKDFRKSMFANHFITPRSATLTVATVRTEIKDESGRPTGEYEEEECLIERKSPEFEVQQKRVDTTSNVTERLLCLKCAECDKFVGDRRSVAKCKKHNHVWIVGQLQVTGRITAPSDEDETITFADDSGEVRGTFHKLDFAVCAAGNAWPLETADKSPPKCPICSRGPKWEIAKHKKKKQQAGDDTPQVFVPENRKLHEAVWAE